jgi:hypothetical protein
MTEFSEFSAAAYCPAPKDQKITCGATKTCPRVEKLNTKVYNSWLKYVYISRNQFKTSLTNNSAGDAGAAGYVAADRTNRNIILAFRGAGTIQNIWAGIGVSQSPCPQYGNGARCNNAFYSFWNQSRDDTWRGLNAAVADHPNFNLIVVGHSIGGAAAMFAAGEIRQQPGFPGKIALVSSGGIVHGKKMLTAPTQFTFGQPRPGNQAFVNFIQAQGQNYRITHTSDIVPKLPPNDFLSEHLLGEYKHTVPEYWISDGLGNNLNNIVKFENVSTLWNEGNAGTGLLKINAVAHVGYFQPNIIACGVNLPVGYLEYPAGSKK